MLRATLSAPQLNRVRETASETARRMVNDWRAYIIVAFVALCSALPGIASMPVMDVDEARFAQASRQMLETGDFVRIRLQDSERNKKPAGVHWLQAASTAALEPIAGKQNAIWTYRIPSVLGALLAALATLWIGRTLLGPQAGLLGASLLAAGVLFGFEGMTAKTDALMVGFTTLALAALASLRATGLGFAPPRSRSRSRAEALVFWGALGCAILIKGPIPLLIVALTLATLAIWDRRAAWMAPLAWWAGPASALAIILPWGVAIGIATDWRFYTAAFTQDLAPKLAGQDHAHGGFFGYHLLLAPLLMFPATFALPAVARFLADKHHHAPVDSSALRFLISWAGPALLMFELSPGKLLHYAMPVYPALALLCGAGFLAALKRGWRWTLGAGVALFALVGVAWTVLAGAGLYELDVDPWRALAAAALCAAIIAGGLASLVLFKSAPPRAAGAIACALLLVFALREAVLPNVPALQLSARAANALGPPDDRPLWIVGYDEPSIVFLTQTSARRASAGDAGALALTGDAVIAERAELPVLQGSLATRGLAFTPRGRVAAGLSMSSNERMTLIAGDIAAGRPTLAQPNSRIDPARSLH